MPSGSIQKPDDDWFTPEDVATLLTEQQDRSRHYALVSEFLGQAPGGGVALGPSI